jgi:bifunctional DNA-binding transcriptional regulator/antitoxin component of YhaV-PrlF toxin-antitoxin module
MTPANRIRIAPDGSLKLPREVSEKLGWTTGSYLEVSVKGDAVELKRVEVDLFAEAVKKPDGDTFEKILRKQKESTEKAFKDFEVKIKDPPQLRPEDRPQFWD